MKKFVKFISLFCCSLLILTSFFFVPVGNTSSYLATTSASTRAVSNNYYYDAELSEENSSLGSYAINSVQNLQVDNSFVINYRCSGTASSDIWVFRYYSSQSLPDGYCRYFCFNNYFPSYSDDIYTTYFNISFLIIVHSGLLQIHPFGGTGSSYQNLLFIPTGASFDFDIYITYSSFEPKSGNWNFTSTPSINDFYIKPYDVVSGVTDYSLDTSYLYDMDSSTNLFMPSDLYVNRNDAMYTIFNNLQSLHDFSLNFTSTSVNSSSSVHYTITQNTVLYTHNVISVHNFWLSKIISSDINFFVSEFWCIIQRPIYRTNNSLILFNYEYYQFLDYMDEVIYVLALNNDNYYINYSGILPNSKFLTFFNSEVNNNYFDTYILLSVSSDKSSLSYSDYTKLPNSVIDYTNHTYSFYLGFDFNFTYYTEPLVSSKGVYNYTFSKPSYVDGSITYSLTPPRLDIPVLAWVENAFIFIVFYCPIISDIIKLLHFDKFFGVIIEMFNIYLSSLFGDFIFGCFALIIFYGLLKLIMPSIASSAKGWDNSPVIDSVSAVHHFNRNRKKQKLLNKKLSSSRNNRVVAKKTF